MVLDSNVTVYPAHGAGTLCGKALSEANNSTIGLEKLSNWSMQDMKVHQFMEELLNDQPFVPKYFPYNVELNKHGAKSLVVSLKDVPLGKADKLNHSITIIDTRPEGDFKKKHLPGSINLQNGSKFETWLGSIIMPEEAFYLVASNKDELDGLILRCAKIGYEIFIEKAFVFEDGEETIDIFDIQMFKTNPQGYTIVDIRNPSEIKEQSGFQNANRIPLPELKERAMEIPYNKSIVIHCAGGYRSAAGSSIIQNALGKKTTVYDFGESIKGFL